MTFNCLIRRLKPTAIIIDSLTNHHILNTLLEKGHYIFFRMLFAAKLDF